MDEAGPVRAVRAPLVGAVAVASEVGEDVLGPCRPLREDIVGRERQVVDELLEFGRLEVIQDPRRLVQHPLLHVPDGVTHLLLLVGKRSDPDGRRCGTGRRDGQEQVPRQVYDPCAGGVASLRNPAGRKDAADKPATHEGSLIPVSAPTGRASQPRFSSENSAKSVPASRHPDRSRSGRHIPC